MANQTHRPDPGDAIPELEDGDTLELEDGVYGPIPHLSDVSNVTIRGVGANPARIVGHDRTDAKSNGLRAEDCSNFKVSGIDVSGFHRGIRTLNCDAMQFTNCLSHDNGMEGFALNDTRGLILTDCEARSNGRNSSAAANRGHGVYVANSSGDITITRLVSVGNKGCGLQFNGDPNSDEVRDFTGFIGGDGPAADVSVQDAQLLLNRNAAGINCASLRNAVFRNILIVDESRDAGGIVFFVDGGDKDFACHHVLLDLFTILMKDAKGRFGIKMDHGAHHITASNGILTPGRAGTIELAGQATQPTKSNVQEPDEAALGTLIPGLATGDFRSSTAGLGWQG
jgi:Right handed beta helix region